MSATLDREPADPPTRLLLFLAFLKIGLLGFGGVAALARHVLVVERRLLGEREFAENFGLASSLPGANTVNLATMLGDRLCGPSGAAAALLGLLGAPLALLALVATLYSRFGHLADVQAALHGSAAAAAGIVMGTSLKILRDLGPDWLALVVTAAVCAAAAAKVPMVSVLATSIPVSLAIGLARKQQA